MEHRFIDRQIYKADEDPQEEEGQYSVCPGDKVGRVECEGADGYKLWNSGTQKGKNGVGILVDRELREYVVEVRRVNDRLMSIKLVVGQCTINVVSAYAPHMGLDEEVKRRFWEGFDEIIQQVPPNEKLFIGGDFNGHIGSNAGVYDAVHGGFGFGERNEGGTSLLDFAKAFGRRDRGLCKDCKVIPGEILVTQHRLLVMDVGIIVKRRKMSGRGRPRIRWGILTKDKAQELEGRLSVMGAWRSSGDANSMWSTTANCIREAAREVLGVSTGVSGRHKGEWWWNKVVQGKVKAKKEAYRALGGA
ncbi:uncharacterized protein [Nicotiana sylvestris]|uniref:uncharacterized protein n=1 Tax=Nicotiana sylvestris TaxID=4096 RepID=UPI00388C5962